MLPPNRTKVVSEGRTAKLAKNDVYIVGDNPDVAIIIIHDLLGWTFPNVRLLADHYAREANATVYIPDFFGGEVLPMELWALQGSATEDGLLSA
ncbi:hypothetical protein KXX21_003450 [Aspergillus fumigatus]|nr:hypothetical protein KXX44_001777 [Aspergillus fumigatus]KAH1611508.1 hypothetical protein KXX21_003450 [Aspergillus fumigatus]KAH1629813.1 hypothetical protein KXX39_003372 [Aspergillus fumigatus]KAH2979838.1 hypothetical protein KXV25_003600 [Aspergillus fumigatus]KAH3334995.1 hypothetical protein KXW81_003993 [Aspergillus fumigatus]